MQILVVEDSPAEARLTQEALVESGFAHEMVLVEDGEKATLYLKREKNFEEAKRPDLIFLDLNLPGKDGRQVLREVKEDPILASIPVIVITNSQAPEDIEQVYRLKGNCYLVKPPGIEEYFAMMRKIVEFWWLTARLPDNPRNPPFPRIPHTPHI